MCNNPANVTTATDSPLSTFELRLSDDVLASPQDILASNPPGQLVLTCSPYGLPGYVWSGGNLLTLAGLSPSSAATCARFSITFASNQSQPLLLSQAFDQDVTLVDAAGSTVWQQAGQTSVSSAL